MRKPDENNQEEKFAREWPVYLLALIVCFILWWGGMMFAHQYAMKEFKSEQKSVTSEKTLSDEEVKGLFGDSFGAVNALVSALAFAGVLVSLYFQRKDLKIQRQELQLQRKELELTRKEMEEQTAEFGKQNETLKIQRFENTFFNMLSQFQEIVNSLSISFVEYNQKQDAMGRDTFKITFENSIVNVDVSEGNRPFKSFRGMANAINAEGIAGYCKADVPTYFDHYFRYLYRILKFVHETPLITKFDDEYEYTSMLRAILSRYELVWLYYNGLSEYGKEKLKPLIERYAMLKSLREDLLVKGVYVGCYAESAYTKTVPEDEK